MRGRTDEPSTEIEMPTRATLSASLSQGSASTSCKNHNPLQVLDGTSRRLFFTPSGSSPPDFCRRQACLSYGGVVSSCCASRQLLLRLFSLQLPCRWGAPSVVAVRRRQLYWLVPCRSRMQRRRRFGLGLRQYRLRQHPRSVPRG